MRKNRKNSSHTRGKKICRMAFLLAGSLVLGGCGEKKEKAADSELPELVIGMDYFEPYSYQTSDGEYKGVDVELAEDLGISQSLRISSGKTKMNFWQMELSIVCGAVIP